MTSTATAYKAGSRHSESWYKAGLRPGLLTDQSTGLKYVPAAREGNTVWSNFASWADAEPGHFSQQGFLDLGGTELLADGVSLGEYGFYGQGTWNVPAAESNLELVYDLIRWQRGDYEWESPSTVETRWKWRSSAADAGKPLPLLFPDYDLAVDLNDRAPRVPVFPINITAESGQWYKPGGFTSARVWASYDDGANWTQAPVINLGTKAVAPGRQLEGQYVRHPQGRTGGLQRQVRHPDPDPFLRNPLESWSAPGLVGRERSLSWCSGVGPGSASRRVAARSG
jgi:hypothetical protein